jgi:hypothetical protein
MLGKTSCNKMIGNCANIEGVLADNVPCNLNKRSDKFCFVLTTISSLRLWCLISKHSFCIFKDTAEPCFVTNV